MKKILIIEDDPAISTRLEETFKEEHFDVATVMSGQMGYEKAKEGNYDLIILDPPAFAKHNNVTFECIARI